MQNYNLKLYLEINNSNFIFYVVENNENEELKTKWEKWEMGDGRWEMGNGK